MAHFYRNFEEQSQRLIPSDSESGFGGAYSRNKSNRVTVCVVVSVLLIAGVTSVLFAVSYFLNAAIFFNGDIYCNGYEGCGVSAFYVEQGKFVEFSDSFWSLAVRHPFGVFSITDLRERTVLPGLIDSRANLANLASSYYGVNLISSDSIKNITDTIEHFIQENEVGENEWIIGHGWDETKFGGNLPNKTDLDNIKNPVWLRDITFQNGWVNSKALSLLDIPETDPQGGIIVRDANNDPTGVFLLRANEIIENTLPVLDEKIVKKSLLYAIDKYNENGITTIVNSGASTSDISALRRLVEDEVLQLRVYNMIKHIDKRTVDEWCDAEKLSNYKNRLSIKAVKMQVDGVIRVRTAALLSAYSDQDTTGLLYQSEPDFSENIEKWNKCGYQISTHAVGDRGTTLAISEYEKIIQEKNGTLNEQRHSIDSLNLITDSSYSIFRDKNIIASVQPLPVSDVDTARLGSRTSIANQWNRLRENNTVVFGSQFSFPELINPFKIIYTATTSETNNMDYKEAIRAYTDLAAFSIFEEENLGFIGVGKFADFIILPIDFSIGTLNSAQVQETYISGKRTFRR